MRVLRGRDAPEVPGYYVGYNVFDFSVVKILLSKGTSRLQKKHELGMYFMPLIRHVARNFFRGGGGVPQ